MTNLITTTILLEENKYLDDVKQNTQPSYESAPPWVERTICNVNHNKDSRRYLPDAHWKRILLFIVVAITGVGLVAEIAAGFIYALRFSKINLYACLFKKNINVLAGKDLSGMDLSKETLTNNGISINFSLLNLKGTNINNANLSGHHLTLSQLWQTKSCRGVNLSHSTITQNTWKIEGQLDRKIEGQLDLTDSDFSEATIESPHIGNINFTNANLSKVIFKNKNIYMDISQATFNETNLSGADLSKAKFFTPDQLRSAKSVENINLSNCNLEYKDWSNLNLSGANLTLAKLNHATLTDIKLNNANLKLAEFNDATLTNAELNDADAEDASFISAEFKDAKLDNIYLKHTKFMADSLIDITSNKKYKTLDASRAKNLTLTLKQIITFKNNNGGKLSGLNLNNMDFSNLDLSDVTFYQCNLKRTKFNNSTLHTTKFVLCKNLTIQQLQSAKLVQSIHLQYMNLTGWNFSNENLEFWDFTGSDLTDAKFIHTTLKNVSFKKTDLSNADLRQADCTNASFNQAYLINATLEWACCYKTTFIDATLNGTDLTGTLPSFPCFKGAHFYDSTKINVADDVRAILNLPNNGSVINYHNQQRAQNYDNRTINNNLVPQNIKLMFDHQNNNHLKSILTSISSIEIISCCHTSKRFRFKLMRDVIKIVDEHIDRFLPVMRTFKHTLLDNFDGPYRNYFSETLYTSDPEIRSFIIKRIITDKEYSLITKFLLQKLKPNEKLEKSSSENNDIINKLILHNSNSTNEEFIAKNNSVINQLIFHGRNSKSKKLQEQANNLFKSYIASSSSLTKCYEKGYFTIYSGGFTYDKDDDDDKELIKNLNQETYCLFSQFKKKHYAFFNDDFYKAKLSLNRSNEKQPWAKNLFLFEKNTEEEKEESEEKNKPLFPIKWNETHLYQFPSLGEVYQHDKNKKQFIKLIECLNLEEKYEPIFKQALTVYVWKKEKLITLNHQKALTEIFNKKLEGINGKISVKLKDRSITLSNSHANEISNILKLDTLTVESQAISFLCLSAIFARYSSSKMFGTSGQSPTILRTYALALLNKAVNMKNKQDEKVIKIDPENLKDWRDRFLGSNEKFECTALLSDDMIRWIKERSGKDDPTIFYNLMPLRWEL